MNIRIIINKYKWCPIKYNTNKTKKNNNKNIHIVKNIVII